MREAPNRRRPWVDPELAGPDGLVGVGGDLRPTTLVRAYSEGVFPWFSPGDPVLWWSPDPRAVIELDGLHVSRSLARIIRSGKFRVTVNQAFGEVIRACAVRPGQGTWITAEMIAAYEALHRLGHAHSLETWIRTDATDKRSAPGLSALSPSLTRQEGNDFGDGWRLAGGIYGVAIGALFAGESMFFRVSDGSKVALVALVERLKARGYEMFDVQMRTDHTGRMGANEIPRREYLQRLRTAVEKSTVTFA
jgi:leucyl/phenylalanyl-tRNA---protein transferase